MLLTGQIKELGAIYKNWLNLNLDLIPIEKWDKKRWIGVVGDADELLVEVVGSVQQRKQIGNELYVLSQELEQTKKESRCKFCLVKRSY